MKIATFLLVFLSLIRSTIVIPEYSTGTDTFTSDAAQLQILQVGTMYLINIFSPCRYVDRYQTFVVPFSQIPQVIMSIDLIDAGLQGLLGFQIIQSEVSKIGFNIRYMALQNTPVSALRVRYLAVVDETIQIAQTVVTQTIALDTTKTKDFTTQFSQQPEIALFVNGVNMILINPTGIPDYFVEITSIDTTQYQFTIYANANLQFGLVSVAVIAGHSKYFGAGYLSQNPIGNQILASIYPKTQVYQLGIIGVSYNIASISGTLRISSAYSIDQQYDVYSNTLQSGDTQINTYRLSYFFYLPCALYCDGCLNIQSVKQCNLCDASTKRINPPECSCPYGYYSLETEVNCVTCLDYCSGCQQSSSYCTTCKLTTLRLIPPLCLTCPNNMFIGYLLSNCQYCDEYCNGCIAKAANCIICSIESQRINPPSCNTCLNQFYSITGIVNCYSCPDNCQQCQNESGACIQCISNNLYIENGKCIMCPIHCKTCNSQICLTLNLCSFPCLTCDENQGLTCISADYQISDGQCSYCPSNCIVCDSTGNCLTAPLNCVKGVANGSKVRCVLCLDNYYIQHDFCVQCSAECLTCTQNSCITCRFIELKTSSCQVCEIYLGLYSNYISNTCYTICGDGAITGTEECDDANDSSFDGCANCKVQQGYICYASFCQLIINPIPSLSQILQNDSAYTPLKSILLTYNAPIKNKTLSIDPYITNNIGFNYTLIFVDSKTFQIDINLQEQCLESVVLINFTQQVQSIEGFIQQVTIVQCSISDYIILNITEQAIVDATDATMYYLFISILVLVITGVLFGGLHVFWNLLDMLQTMSYLKYVNTVKPLFLYQFFEIFAFLQFQNLPINRFVNTENISSLINYNQPSELPLYITLDGYNSCTILNIIPIINVFIGGYVIYYTSKILLKIIMYINSDCLIQAFENKQSILKVILNFRQSIIKFLDKLCTQWFWSGVIRIFISSSFDISFIIALGLFEIQCMSDNEFILLNFIITVILLVGFLAICFTMIIIIGVQTSHLKSNQYQSLCESLKIQQYAKFYNIFLMYKRLNFMLGIILLYNQPIYQIMTIVLLQIIQISYLYWIDPLKNPLERLKQKISETMMLLAEIQLAILVIDDESAILSYDQRKLIGWLSVFSYSAIITTQLFIDVLQQFYQYKKRYPWVRQCIQSVKCMNKQSTKKH